MQQIFGGAAKPLVIHFARNSKFTAEEVRQLIGIRRELLERIPAEERSAIHFFFENKEACAVSCA